MIIKILVDRGALVDERAMTASLDVKIYITIVYVVFLFHVAVFDLRVEESFSGVEVE